MLYIGLVESLMDTIGEMLGKIRNNLSIGLNNDDYNSISYTYLANAVQTILLIIRCISQTNSYPAEQILTLFFNLYQIIGHAFPINNHKNTTITTTTNSHIHVYQAVILTIHTIIKYNLSHSNQHQIIGNMAR